MASCPNYLKFGFWPQYETSDNKGYTKWRSKVYVRTTVTLQTRFSQYMLILLFECSFEKKEVLYGGSEHIFPKRQSDALPAMLSYADVLEE